MVFLLLSELQGKDIISLYTGDNLGRIVDVEVDNEGKIISLIAEPKRMFLRFIKGKETTFKFSDVEKFGNDVILIKM